MARQPRTPLSIEAERELQEVAQHIQIARKRRKMPLRELSERTSISVATLARLEHGDPSVAIGTVLQVLSTLKLVSGLASFLAPESDLRQTMEEARELRIPGRRGGRRRTFRDEELEF